MKRGILLIAGLAVWRAALGAQALATINTIPGSMRNGMTSALYGSYPLSYSLSPAR